MKTTLIPVRQTQKTPVPNTGAPRLAEPVRSMSLAAYTKMLDPKGSQLSMGEQRARAIAKSGISLGVA